MAVPTSELLDAAPAEIVAPEPAHTSAERAKTSAEPTVDGENAPEAPDEEVPTQVDHVAFSAAESETPGGDIEPGAYLRAKGHFESRNGGMAQRSDKVGLSFRCRDC